MLKLQETLQLQPLHIDRNRSCFKTNKSSRRWKLPLSICSIIYTLTLEWVNWPKKLSRASNSKQNCLRNHPKKYLLEIQRFGSPGFGLKLRVRMGSYGVLTTQLQAKSWRAKPLNFQKISFGVVPHTILLGIRGSTKFFWSIDPLYST